ncbi:hypothetical protein FACS1894132_11060 [Clostridia bacterium]|nr:hypothetical protein FACS1894132_11060 [Clostridia bacterium]
MLKKTITYTDFDGNERTEDFYFNLSKAEVTELQYGTTGGIDQFLRKIVTEQDTKNIIKAFKEILLLAYGEKSPDGRRFVKSKEISDGFSQTEAYSDLFMELASNAEVASEFINGIIPQQLQANPQTGIIKS